MDGRDPVTHITHVGTAGLPDRHLLPREKFASQGFGVSLVGPCERPARFHVEVVRLGPGNFLRTTGGQGGCFKTTLYPGFQRPQVVGIGRPHVK